MRFLLTVLLALVSPACLVTPVSGDEAVTGSRIHNLKVLSDKIDDVTTIENILKSFVKPGMKDAERARALWTAAVKYRHQTTAPNEYLAADWETHDPVKLFNVYGYCLCCCSASLIEALNQMDGREVRGRILTGHSVPEVKYDGAWHMFDASLVTYFPKPQSNDVASVDDISDAVRAWYAKHPAYRGSSAKLDELMRRDQWSGWKSGGPELLANCPFYTLGWLPARTHGWNATMVEYDRPREFYDYGYQVGHRALFSLRRGESWIRESGNRGLHVNMMESPVWDALTAKAPENDLVYLRQFMPPYNGGIVANGYHRYAPDLAAGDLAAGADVYENLKVSNFTLHPRTAGQAGLAILELASPYVYLGGRLKIEALRKAPDDQVTISISTNNARSFVPVWSARQQGSSEATIDLRSFIFRRYTYWVKIEIKSKSGKETGLKRIAVENDIQHAPRTLPWLGRGDNTITIAADRDTKLASRSVACRITSDDHFDKNETIRSMGVRFDNLDLKYEACWWKGGVGTMTVPIDTPGELVALRCSSHIRARGTQDMIKVLVSFDGGDKWQEVARIKGPTPGRTESFGFKNVPRGARKALMRYELTGNNTIGILSFRIDVDYKDPIASKMPGPFQVTYRWKENGHEKTQVNKVDRLPYTYHIKADAVPEMVYVSYSMQPR